MMGRKVAVSLAVLTVPLAITGLVRTQPAAKAEIVAVQVLPRALGKGGGLVVVESDVENALSCQLRVLSHQSFRVVYSHNPSPGCQGGYFTADILIGRNPALVAHTVAFALVVRNKTSSVSNRFYVEIAAGTSPAPAPSP